MMNIDTHFWLMIGILVDVWMQLVQSFSFRLVWMNLNAQRFANAQDFEEKWQLLMFSNVRNTILLYGIAQCFTGGFHHSLTRDMIAHPQLREWQLLINDKSGIVQLGEFCYL